MLEQQTQAPSGVTFDEPLQQSTTVNVPAGVTFDAPTKQPTSISVGGQPAATAPQPASSVSIGTLSPVREPANAAESIERWAQDFHDDLMHGTDRTKLGALLKFIGAPGLEKGVSHGVADFMGSPVLGPNRVVKGASELAQSGKRWEGTKDTIGGALDATTIPSSFVAPEGGEVAGAAFEHAADGIQNAAKVAKRPFSLQTVQDALAESHADIHKSLETATHAIQEDWHDTVRGLFDGAAKELGVTPAKAESLRDVASTVSDAAKAKAQGLYRQADAALGGTRFQSFQDKVANIRRVIREEVGLDPEKDAVLQKRLEDAEAAHQAAKEQLASKGLGADLVDRADALYKRAMALADVSKPIQSATTGLRGDLVAGGNAVAEAISPTKLAARINRLYDAGRLQQALGEEGAGKLLQGIEETKQRLKDAATAAKQQADAARSRAATQTDAVKRNRLVAGSAATALGVPAVWERLKHLIGD